ncbi:MAG: hypothetical protein H6605_10830 [Flavobacteriales bacterium]|nr:hypothetical protein [Flavobacteriales bacterium]
MKKILVLLGFIGFHLATFAQFEGIISKLPTELKKGVVIYLNSDTSVFVFKAEDYIKSSGGIDPVNIDSPWYKDYAKLRDTLNYAITNQYIVIGNEYTKIGGRDYKIFPNSAVLIELFSSRKIILFQKTSGTFYEINYIHKRRHGFYYIIKKGTKAIFFECGYRIIERK